MISVRKDQKIFCAVATSLILLSLLIPLIAYSQQGAAKKNPIRKSKGSSATLTEKRLLVFSGSSSLSAVGSSIEVESYRCEVTSSRTIDCINIGRVCEAARVKQREEHEHYFGCALDDWKKSHPGESCASDLYFVPAECLSYAFGPF